MEKMEAQDAQRRSLLKLGLASGLSAGGLLAGCGGDSAAAPDTRISSFALAVLPDTQFYSRYATSSESSQYERHYGTEPYAAQTSWVARNAQALNIPFLIHLGDVVDQVGKPEQWKVADGAMQVLEAAKVPYSILAGNHDVLNDIDFDSDPAKGTDTQRVLANEPYLQWFGARRAQRQATFGARDSTGFHEYHIFTAQDQQFLVLSLSWRISDAGIAWARKVLADHPTLPAILVNHQLLNIAPDAVSPLETGYGKMLWEKLIRDNDQIFMTLNGHHHGGARLTKTNDFGNAVEEMVVDYQMAYQGGNGLMRLYEFDLTNNQIKVLSFSPWVPMKPADTLNAFDRAVLTEGNHSFTIDMNFAKRFARFNSGFGAGKATVASSLVEQARALVLKGYTEPATVAPVAPKDADDYPKVASTVAHWRFYGGSDGAPVAPGTRIADVTGANPLVRDQLNQGGIVGAAVGDIVWSSDHHRLSSAPGSVSFLNTDKNAPRLSYFLTDATAAINAQTFATTGYTIEAFVKINPAWDKAKHAWMNIMTRDGKRGGLAGFDGGDPESPPLLFAISSLREVQWEVVPDVGGQRDAMASWSGEIIAGNWVHIAIVNDPVTHDTVMYVEGAPVLRNSSHVVGLASSSASSPWVVGGGSWDGARADGFFGNIGEVRVAGAALPPSQWLTARRS
ncbi:modulator protein [Duganella sp. BJB488]|uniref:LamG-like jellyroll fold domain-containing protein n=1 Tax=unclassified Duganella TaxID=2636909 RepID=UPI000E34B4D9|nr:MULTISPECIES: LamG-like jellyroll fold domain-containing protein [unclassified Duganella]RFP26163.1 modulator protein [Duganella sp. BJB489]RFP28098.1 modulator protein [Duganella sp. BJB488]RFP37091.1 modulator protein [Duganella sp. BJB480]